MSVLTLWRVSVAAGVRLRAGEPRPAGLSPHSGAAREDFVHATILRLHVFDLHDVLQPVDGASKVNLPHGRVRLVPILSGVECPLTKQSGVPLLAVAALLCMDPWHAEDCLLLVDPFQPVKALRVDHPHDPVAHAFGPFVAYLALSVRAADDR